MKQIKTIYFDMDGVLADFNKKFCEYNHCTVEDMIEMTEDEFWIKVRGVPFFWESLEIIDGSKELFAFACEHFNVEILSAPSRNDKRSVEGKGRWLRENFGEFKYNINLVRAENKKLFANKESILIDDLESNIDGFVENGGHGLLFKNSVKAMEVLSFYLSINES